MNQYEFAIKERSESMFKQMELARERFLNGAAREGNREDHVEPERARPLPAHAEEQSARPLNEILKETAELKAAWLRKQEMLEEWVISQEAFKIAVARFCGSLPDREKAVRPQQ